MLNKEKLLNHIKDNDLKMTLLKALSLVDRVINNHEIKNTGFMTPYELREFLSVLKGIREVNFHVGEEIPLSERKIVYVYPDYFDKDDIETEITCIKLTGNFKFRTVSHRDYLGSLLGLGIVRERIGDIFVHDDKAYVIVLKNIGDFILFNLEKVANLRVKLEVVDSSTVVFCEPEYKEVAFTISSERLDAIIAGIFNVSRSTAVSLISNERVSVDYEKITSSSKSLKGGELISVKGYGRGRFVGIEYTTKKDRLKVRGKVYK